MALAPFLTRLRPGLWLQYLTASQLLVLSFAGLIGAGTVGWKLFPGLYTGRPLTWLEALFTTTSAVCVTGLTVVDTSTFFTFWGQLYLLVLFQLGGLGIITFSTLVIMALGGRLSLRAEALGRTATDVAPHVDFRSLTRDIILFTVSIEAVGAVLLYLLWIPDLGAGGAVWPALFHAVSAFCHAGFSTFSHSLLGHQTMSLSLWVIAALVVLGSLGFLTLEEFLMTYRRRRQGKPIRLSLHSKLALVTTFGLLTVGWAAFLVFEWQQTFAALGVWDKITNALFMSVTPRSGGFNTIDYAQATDSSNYLTILLMSIGGSPGSSAGGLKTTTFALIGLLAYARIKGHEATDFWNRSIPEETVQRSVGLAVIMFTLVSFALFVLIAINPVYERTYEGQRFLALMFEAVSAFNTVGLSMGITTLLSPWGQFVLVLLMFLGRVGPLTFGEALARRARLRATQFRYAYEDVVIG